ncbi:hypothetical protein ACFGVR_16995 [Mucilaginibacter sp. AW1-3]
MNKIEARKAAARALERKRGWKKYRLYALYAVGLVGAGYATRQYHDIFINMWLLVFIDIIAGFLLAILIEKNYKNWGWATVCFGGLIVGPLVLINDITHEPLHNMKVSVKTVHTRSSKKYSPYAVVHCFDMDKNVLFYDNERDQLDTARYIRLTVQKGNLGYYIIRESKLDK